VTGERRQCVSRDAHAGFTGARDRRNLYRLDLKQVSRKARYVVIGRIQARAGHGTVAERGTAGRIMVGTKKEGSDGR